ncbi:MAG: D-serine deaminase-like pyridoxal phosphate-dependent protein [Candidatus Azotimanducaceae bacterium]|jgi:D-serine deaminase-like pyridoxal phosphate-dependent protein
MSSLFEFYETLRRSKPSEPIVLDKPVPLESLDTPALIIDLDQLDANLDRMQKHIDKHGMRLRSHTKMHKCPELARRQVDKGAIGVCTAKVSEAEVMCDAGIEDVLVTSPLATREKVERFIRLGTVNPGLKIVVDNKDSAELLNKAAIAEGIKVGVFIDIDPGMGRTGVEAGARALQLCQQIGGMNGLRFEGLQMYAGNCMHIEGFEARQQKYAHILKKGFETLILFKEAGIEVPIVSGGGTGTYNMEPDLDFINELQAGSYAFMDIEYRDIGGIASEKFEDFGVALFVLVTAISQPQDQLITVDGGFKSFASDKMPPQFRDVEGLVYHWGGDEHGIVQLNNLSREVSLGNKLAMITPHCDPTVNLHDYYFPYRDGIVHEIWPITARGCSF